jgi:hypothetical protein
MSRPTPRRVRFTTSTQITRRGMLSFWIVLFLLLARQAVYDIKDLNLLSQEGKTVDAPITSRETYKVKSKTKCRITYGVSVEGNYFSSRTSEPEEACLYPKEDSVVFTYLPEQSTVYREGTVGEHRIQNQKTNWIFWLIVVMSILAVMIGAIEHSYRQQRYLWEYGMLATAKVIRRWEVNDRKNVSHYMEYLFQTESGLSLRMEKRVGSAGVYLVNTTLSVLYDPKNPFHNDPAEWCKAAEVVT